MIKIEIDGCLFEVSAEKVLMFNGGEFKDAPDYYAILARKLVLCDYEDVGERTHINGCPLYERFIDSHGLDESCGEIEIPEGRDSGLQFPLKAGMPPVRATKVITGTIHPGNEKIIVVMEWHDPLNEIMTTSEAENLVGLKEGTIKKACQRGIVKSRKSGNAWLVRKADIQKRWG